MPENNKKETEARLTNSKDNLKRVKDLDSELTNRLELLKEQAEKANQFKNINNELSLLKTKYYLCLIENNKEQLNKLKVSLDTQKLEKEKIKSNLVAIETKLDELKVNENELSNDLRLIQASLYEKNSFLVLIFFFLATEATFFDGSIPNISVLDDLKFFRSVPSLEPISIIFFVFLK